VKKTDARMLVFQEEEGKGSMARNPLTTKAMEAWKASGPTNEDITKSNAFDSLYTHLQIVQDGAGKERKVDASPMVFQEEQESEGDMNSQTPEALCTTKLMEVWKASGPSNADDMSSIVDAFGTGARGLNAPNTHEVLNDKKRNPMSEIRPSSNGNANIAQPRKRTTSIGGNSYSNRSRSGSGGSSSSRTRSRRSSGISVFKDSSNSERKKPLLDRPRPKSLAGQARSKSDGTKLFDNSSGSTSSSSSSSISSASASRPSTISCSTSTGSPSSLSQNRERTISAGGAGSYFHYR